MVQTILNKSNKQIRKHRFRFRTLQELHKMVAQDQSRLSEQHLAWASQIT